MTLRLPLSWTKRRRSRYCKKPCQLWHIDAKRYDYLLELWLCLRHDCASRCRRVMGSRALALSRKSTVAVAVEMVAHGRCMAPSPRVIRKYLQHNLTFNHRIHPSHTCQDEEIIRISSRTAKDWARRRGCAFRHVERQWSVTASTFPSDCQL